MHKVRKGITPVIAIVLLLMMTVAVAGGAYAWMQGIFTGQQEQASFQQNTELRFIDVQCTAGAGTIDFTLKNDGSTTLDGSTVDVFVYNVSSGNLAANANIAKSPTDFGPGGLWQDSGIGVGSISFVSGREYRIRFEFTNDFSFPVEDTCRAQ